MDYVRRRALTTEGEPLLLGRSVLESAVRFDTFRASAGLAATDLISSPLASVPLPNYATIGTRPDGTPRRRWAGTHPQIMWHPLMWLPASTTTRHTITTADGRTLVEDDTTWVIRTCLEATASGLYDAATGAWIDILSTVGLNVEDDLDLARVQDWLDGEPDEVLDDIDLSHHLAVEPATWALEAALLMREHLTRASWALTADELLACVEELSEPSTGMSPAQLRDVTHSFAAMAAAILSPADTTDTGFFTHLASATAPTADTTDEQVRELVEEMADLLTQIRDENWPVLDTLAETFETTASPLG